MSISGLRNLPFCWEGVFLWLRGRSDVVGLEMIEMRNEWNMKILYELYEVYELNPNKLRPVIIVGITWW